MYLCMCTVHSLRSKHKFCTKAKQQRIIKMNKNTEKYVMKQITTTGTIIKRWLYATMIPIVLPFYFIVFFFSFCSLLFNVFPRCWQCVFDSICIMCVCVVDFLCFFFIVQFFCLPFYTFCAVGCRRIVNIQI